ncbi:MAG TPA: sulfur oxidation c-type cytochrome SoxA [Burkholderiaceae bacterium]|nr:sulfur oxidation c-type cytochrome SoxA [Burkholderiaceae bacterium]
MKRLLVAAAAALLVAAHAIAQTTSDGIAEYRAMLADGNPAELWQAKGEALWKTPRGPKNATLQQCDLGLGPGVVKGAFVTLPRWFKDTGRVQDLESRLLTCLQELQGFDAAEIAKTPFGRGEQASLESLVAWISSESMGMAFALPQGHAEERAMYEAGKRIFYFRAGPYDFACASCHSQAGKRIRLQDLPELTTAKGAGAGFGAWPAYRVSSGELWSLQRRLNDCFRQQRFPYPGYGSDATVALGVYMGVTARGAASIAPALKR